MTDYDSLSESEEIDLSNIRASEAKTHSELCAVQSFCFNGGTCYRLKSLAMHYCECPDNFEGRRCHTKKMTMDYETGEVSGADSLNWNAVKPLVIVIGGVFACILALFCVYLTISFCRRLYWNRKGKYRFDRQPSVSDLPLVVEENSKDNGDSGRTTRASPKSRGRLSAVSSTPEPTKSLRVVVVQSPAPDHHGLRHTPPPLPRASTDVELDRSAISPSRDLGRTPGRQPSLKTPPIGGGAHGGSAVVVVAANSRSPSDSNNNEEEVASTEAVPFEWTFLNSSAHGRQPPTRQDDTRYHPVPRNGALSFSDSPSSRKQSDQFYDDTDRHSTAV